MKKASDKRPDRKNDDVVAWVVIGLVLGAVTLVLYLPLIYRLAHNA